MQQVRQNILQKVQRQLVEKQQYLPQLFIDILPKKSE
jgi:hypothetical protein